MKTIVVGTDGSETATAAVEEAAALAAAFDADLHVVSAYRRPSQVMVPPEVVVPASYDQDAAEAVQALLSEVTEGLSRRGLRVKSHAIANAAGAALVEVAAAHGADLIVVGSRGMHGARRVLGSVPNHVTHHATCNVLLVNTD